MRVPFEFLTTPPATATVTIDATIRSSTDLLATLCQALDVPGRTWDALVDRLGDASWQAGTEASIDHASLPSLPDAALATYLGHLADALARRSSVECAGLRVTFRAVDEFRIRRLLHGIAPGGAMIPLDFHDATLDRFVRDGRDLVLEIEDAYIADPDVTQHGTLRLHDVMQLHQDDIAVESPIPSVDHSYAQILDLDLELPRVFLLLAWRLTTSHRDDVIAYVAQCARVSWTPRAAVPIARYLGQHISDMLGDSPFRDWSFHRDHDEELECLDYTFEQHGLEVRCDVDERIATIFLRCGDRDALFEPFLAISASMKRRQVRDHFGWPEKSGEGRRDPVLGDYGPFDRFVRPGHAIHVEYRAGEDRITLVTLMRADAVP